MSEMQCDEIQNDEKDYYKWLNDTSELIKEGNFTEFTKRDIESIADTLEYRAFDLRGKLNENLRELIESLLRWKLQPERRGNRLESTIYRGRRIINELLEHSPSLRDILLEDIEYSYEYASSIGYEPELDNIKFPKNCPFSLEELLDKNFFPGEREGTEKL